MMRKSRTRRSKRRRRSKNNSRRFGQYASLFFKQKAANKVAGATGMPYQFVLNRIENIMDLLSGLLNKFYKHKEITGILAFLVALAFGAWYMEFIPYDSLAKAKNLFFAGAPAAVETPTPAAPTAPTATPTPTAAPKPPPMSEEDKKDFDKVMSEMRDPATLFDAWEGPTYVQSRLRR